MSGGYKLSRAARVELNIWTHAPQRKKVIGKCLILSLGVCVCFIA